MKKEELKQSILKSAYEVLCEKGVGAIRMRDLANENSCAVGTIYNVYTTFEEIHFHLNLRTFKLLFKILFECLSDCTNLKLIPEETISKMGWEYIEFAKKNTNCWKSLFENAPENTPPVWYRKEIDDSFRKIEALLEKAFHLTEEKASRLMNYFWFSIHGVCSIVLNKKATNSSEEFVEAYVDHCVKGIYNLI